VIRFGLIGLGVLWILTGISIFADPMSFYEIVPGLRLMGPFNMHFIRDVGLAFVVSGGALAWGAYVSAQLLVYAGLAWPSLHALFHIQIWGHRGFPLDGIFAFDLVAVIGPPLLALLAMWKFGLAGDTAS
jgi:hypothetical protein